MASYARTGGAEKDRTDGSAPVERPEGHKVPVRPSWPSVRELASTESPEQPPQFDGEDDRDDYDDDPSSIHTQMELHDRYGLELKIHSGHAHVAGELDAAADTAPGAATGSRRRVHYKLEAYLHFPANFGVNSDNYPAQTFFEDSRAFLRREPPSLWLRDPETGARIPRIDHSLLEAIRDELQRLIDSGRAQPAEAASQVLLFGSALRRSVKEMRRLLKTPRGKRLQTEEVLERLDAVPEFLHELGHLYAEFRTFRRKLRHVPHIVSPAFTSAALTVDETASYMFEDALARIDRRIGKVMKRHDAPDIAARAMQVRDTLVRAAHVELAYRKRKGFCVHGRSHTGREYFLYRVGQLKKAIDSALYFDIRTLETPSKAKHIIGGIGAAFAAAWAFFTQVGGPGLPTISGISTFLLFSLAVAAYIAKDRIKDLTKEKLSGWWFGRIPDRMSVFDHSEMLGAARLSGELREMTGWMSADDAPDIVRTVRDSGHVVDVIDERRESVLRYEKTVDYTIEAGAEDPSIMQANNVKDLFRFRVRNFLKALDDPTRRISFFDESENGFRADAAPKVYHLNVVLAYRVYPDGDPERTPRTTYERIRIILTREGILRLEPVLPRAAHDWLQRDSESGWLDPAGTDEPSQTEDGADG